MNETASGQPAANSRFLAFFDECGDHSLVKIDPDFPLFVLALVVVERAAYRDTILPEMNRLKLGYWNHEGINLHSRDIRVAAGPFNILLNAERPLEVYGRVKPGDGAASVHIVYRGGPQAKASGAFCLAPR